MCETMPNPLEANAVPGIYAYTSESHEQAEDGARSVFGVLIGQLPLSTRKIYSQNSICGLSMGKQ